jgi:hypothetical protein
VRVVRLGFKHQSPTMPHHCVSASDGEPSVTASMLISWAG